MGSEARARLALVGVISVSLLAYGQIFKSSEYFGPAFLGIVLAASLTLVWRRLGLGTVTTVLLMAVALLWYLVLIFQADHTLYGLPTPEALERLTGSVDYAYDRIRIDYEPVPVRTGYAVMIVVGGWLAAVIGELAAFRWRRPFIASAPALGLFTVAVVVSDRDHAAFLIMLFLSTLVTYWGLVSSHSLRSWGRWISTWSDDEAYATSLTAGLARRMGATCVAAALVAPVILPALDEGLLSWRSGGGDGPGGAEGAGRIDHLVSIKPALIEQSTNELFRVRASRAAYWRLVTLTRFDGDSWWPQGSPGVSVGGGTINTPDVVYDASADVAQDFTITGLRGEFLPAAVAPATISFEESADDLDRALFDPSTGAIQLDGGIEDPPSYSVLSFVPDLSYRELTDAPIASGPDATLYTTLPPGLAPEVRQIARAWTRNAKTPGEKLIAIQNRLRDFSYSLDVEPEDSGDYLLEFLTRTRAGYCQQFATAFAVLARSLGFPARVSVGFLPGETSPERPDLYSVQGTDAHAWPEVAFDGVGWVAFEPTPRGEAPPPTHTVRNPARFVGPTEGTLPPASSRQLDGPFARSFGEPPRDPAQAAGGSERPAPAWTKAFGRVAGTLTGIVVAFLVCVPIIKSWRTRRRYRRAHTPGATATAAFAHFVDEAGELASRRVPSESPRAYAARVAAARKLGRKDALRLASIYEVAAYAAFEVPQQDADEARKLATRLRLRLWTNSSWWERALRLFSPTGLRTSASRL